MWLMLEGGAAVGLIVVIVAGAADGVYAADDAVADLAPETFAFLVAGILHVALHGCGRCLCLSLGHDFVGLDLREILLLGVGHLHLAELAGGGSVGPRGGFKLCRAGIAPRLVLREKRLGGGIFGCPGGNQREICRGGGVERVVGGGHCGAHGGIIVGGSLAAPPLEQRGAHFVGVGECGTASTYARARA